MALIKCEECGKDISDKAYSCPNCGNPLAPVTENEGVVTIQLQKKKWKKQKLIAIILVILGWFFLMKGLMGGGAEWGGFGAFLFFIGFIWAIIAKIGSWWSTG